jgi:glycosyltransferase involved in cell wall biosynthesis
VTRIGYGAADLIVATSHGVASDLTRAFAIDPDRIRVIPNPVDLTRVRLAAADPVDESVMPPGEGPLIVAAGRLAEAKNYPLMIEAFAEIRRQLNARLLILGQGELEHTLRQLIDARGLAGAIVLAGFQANPWKYIARADLFLLTSKYEGFGNVLIEAMACGVPVVATASAGTRDIVRHGVDGWLVDQHTPATIAAAVMGILAPPARRTEMARSAREGAERFSIARVVTRYEDELAGVA